MFDIPRSCKGYTTTGLPCSNVAEQGKDLCLRCLKSKAGAPEGNTNALKHGLSKPVIRALDTSAIRLAVVEGNKRLFDRTLRQLSLKEALEEAGRSDLIPLQRTIEKSGMVGNASTHETIMELPKIEETLVQVSKVLLKAAKDQDDFNKIQNSSPVEDLAKAITKHLEHQELKQLSNEGTDSDPFKD